MNFCNELALMTCDATGVVYFVEGTPTALERYAAVRCLTRLKASQSEMEHLRQLGAVPMVAKDFV